jgi:hypothetical protein
MEISPLKESLGCVLASTRTVGHDAMSGESLQYEPLPADLAVHLIEAAWKDGGDGQIEELLKRATELCSSSDEFLKSAEADIEKIVHTIPAVTSASLQSDYELDQRAAELRKEARNGSFALRNDDDSSTTSNVGTDKRTNIQSALGSSIVNNKRNQFQPN